jgi:vitamin B12/bleomycin/antimicrobial peptide transport system ATP-binding/permease protein
VTDVTNGQHRATLAAANPGAADLKGSATGFLVFAAGFWSGRLARQAWILSIAIVVILLTNLGINIGLNRWHRWFFDSLERRDAAILPLTIATFAGLVLVGAGFAVAMVKARMTLQVNWRKWVTETLLATWFGSSKLTSPPVQNENHGSSAFRMAEDVRLAIDPIAELAIGLINAIISAITFFSILVIVGGSWPAVIGDWTFEIPGYIALAALLHATFVSGTTIIVGQPLVRRVAQKNEAEAQLLFELTRFADGGAGGRVVDTLSTSQPHTAREVSTAFRWTIGRWRGVIHEHARLTWIINSNSYVSPVLPLLLAAPKYMSGEMSLGTVMQVAAAYTIVLGALNWLSDNYIRLAEWSASARRVDELRNALRIGAA